MRKGRFISDLMTVNEAAKLILSCKMVYILMTYEDCTMDYNAKLIQKKRATAMIGNTYSLRVNCAPNRI